MIIKWGKLFGGTVLPNNFLFGGTGNTKKFFIWRDPIIRVNPTSYGISDSVAATGLGLKVKKFQILKLY